MAIPVAGRVTLQTNQAVVVLSVTPLGQPPKPSQGRSILELETTPCIDTNSQDLRAAHYSGTSTQAHTAAPAPNLPSAHCSGNQA